MTAKRQLLAEIAALPEDVTLEAALERIHRPHEFRLALNQPDRPLRISPVIRAY